MLPIVVADLIFRNSGILLPIGMGRIFHKFKGTTPVYVVEESVTPLGKPFDRRRWGAFISSYTQGISGVLQQKLAEALLKFRFCRSRKVTLPSPSWCCLPGETGV